jgi:phage terminase large subunit
LDTVKRRINMEFEYDFEFNPKLFNPLHWHLAPALRDPNIRYIYIEGGSSAAKTGEICNTLLKDQLEYDYSSLIFRRFHVDIRDSVYSSFEMARARLDLQDFYVMQQDLFKSTVNEARLRFRGLDNEENVKGIEKFNVVYNNEWNQFTEAQWSQQRKRLRGRPNQKFICDWNPVSANLWIYKNWLDLEEWRELPLTIKAPTKYSGLNPEYSFKRINKRGDSIWIKVTYRDNFWVVGHPSGKGGYRDEHTLTDFERDRISKPNLYRVYANGERGIVRTGGEFWKQFNETIHVRPLKVEKNTIHISLDENVNPYVTVACWQYIEKELRQVHEIPCRSPDNNAPKAAMALIKWLISIDYKDVLFIYGDPSASARSTVDENNASFYDKLIEVLRKAGFTVVSRVAKSAPEVALSAAFINDIYESQLYGYSIVIGDTCKVSIDDYCMAKEDKDGKMLKAKIKDKDTGVTYEPVGHYSDQKRYFITTILQNEFRQYKARTSKYKAY